MDKRYNLKLDLQFRCNNSTMKFNQFDNNTSDFFMRITNSGKLVDIEKSIVVLAVIKPSGKVSSQFVEVENGLVYADLKPSMIDEIGTYTAQAMLILEDERVVTDTINYEVNESKILSAFIEDAGKQEDYNLLTNMLSRLSTIEASEEQRIVNEAERILSEENRKIEEAKRVEAELIRQHEEADRAKYDATRESNENIRKQNESIRLTNETNRIDEETKRVEEENKRKLAEEERNANYNFMTEDEERRRIEANAHKEAEVLRVQAETNRVNEEAKIRTTEQARVSAENTRVNNENTRKANETTRQTNETHRVEAETQRQNRYNSFIADAEANANDFENYTNTAKAKEEERKANELDRKSQEARRVSNEVERISNENTRKANEKAREKNETSRQYVFENKVNEVDKKIIEINTTKDNFVSSINTKVDTKISELDNTKDNFVSSVNTKVDNKISELDNAKSDMANTVSNKVNEVETRFNALTSSQQQDAEVIDARVDFKGVAFNSLKERIDYTDKLLRDNTVSTVETESDFTTVEATSNGYFEDVKLEGKTLVNLSDIKQFSISGAGVSIHTNIDKIKPNATYTRIVYITKNTLVGANERGMVGQLNDGERVILNKDIQIAQNFVGLLDCSKYTISDITREKLSSVRIFSVNTGGVLEGYEIILEGDHTQNPPSGYIEGLKSVGDTTDEISVESVNENLFDETKISYPYIVKVGEKSNGKNLNVIKVKPNTTYTFKAKATNGIVGRVLCILGDKKIKFDGNTNTQSTIFNYFRDNYANGRVFEYKQLNQNPITFTTYNDTNYVYINADCSANGVDEWVIESIQLNEGLQIKEYTPHKSDKKRLLYYNEETQTWEKPILREWDSIEKHSDGKYYYHVRSKEGDYVEGDESLNDCITDLTVSVKKLAEEKVYECTNIDLITYANETNYIVECGAISPKTTLKVHNNISNVVSLLQKKVSLLENNITSYMITQNRLMLASRYNADNVTFKVDYPSMMSEREVEIDYDLFKLIQDNIIVGPKNYDVDKMLEIMDLYAMIGFITWEMWDYLYEVIYSQINPVIEDLEGTPEI